MKLKLVLGVLLIAGVAAAYWHFGKEEGLSAEQFVFTKIEKGDITQTVTGSGALQPINVVSVGTQVSGTIERVLVDYNDEVKEGQLLAELDQSILKEDLKEAEAALELAKSKLKIARLNYNRLKKLYDEKLISKAELEEAEIQLETEKSNLMAAEAALSKVKRNLGYTMIVSPVSGTIIAKVVEEGQTVAASYQTPELFTVAEDLKKMQIEANISEADIGVIKKGMDVTFTVDSYPTEVFKGVVSQIRLNPTEDQNVIMYTVVIDVDNQDKRLLPGMTAFTTILIQEKKDVLKVESTVLQFKVPQSLRPFVEGGRPARLKGDEARVFTFENGKLVPHVIVKGISDIDYTEVVSGLKEGDEIVSEYTMPRKR